MKPRITSPLPDEKKCFLICNLRIGICNLFVVFCLALANLAALAQENDKLVVLSRQVIEAGAGEDLLEPFEQLKELYFKENKYSEFADFLKSLGAKKRALEPYANYYISLARYHQLKYLEEKQVWDEYFAQGNKYREELVSGAQKTIAATTRNNPLYIYSRLLLWRFHKDQQDAFSEGALTDLINAVSEYAKSSLELKPIKAAADELLSRGEKWKSKQIYKIYADKIIASDIKAEGLKNKAFDFYREGNLELSEALYDVYIDKIGSLPKEKLIPALADIAKQFAYNEQGLSDQLYAETVFKRIEGLAGKSAFTQELIYLRAFNLETIKEYIKAKDIYLELLGRFPDSPWAAEANFKAGIIYAYVLRDIATGRSYLDKLAKKEIPDAWMISSLYQLGLFSQWGQDYAKAKEFYASLLEKAGSGFAETTALAKARMKEIEESRPLEYNLKAFLDASLKEEYAASGYDMTKVDLKSSPRRITKEKNLVNISASAYLSESGCMQVNLEYLWSGDLGQRLPSPQQPAFDTTYTDSGTKVISLVVVSASGIIDRAFVFLDAY